MKTQKRTTTINGYLSLSQSAVAKMEELWENQVLPAHCCAFMAGKDSAGHGSGPQEGRE